MTQSPRSSFIPKQAAGALPSRVRRKRKFRVLSFVSMVLLVGSVVLAGVTSFYKDYSESKLESKKQDLAKESNRFNEADLASVIEFDRRLRAADFLLRNHLAPSKIFNALELRTKERVQFTDFAFSQNPSRDVTLTIGGGTEAFNSVALQSLQFGEDALFKDAVFADISTRGADIRELTEGAEITALASLRQEHPVGFTVTAAIPSELLVYTVSQTVNESSFQDNFSDDAADEPEGDGVGTGDVTDENRSLPSDGGQATQDNVN